MRFPYMAGQIGKRFRTIAGGGGGGDDPFIDDVVALLHFDGTDGSTTFTDETGKTWTTPGTAKLDTGIVKFGTASLEVDSTSNCYISTTSSADFGFGTGDYTVEGWCYVDDGFGPVQTFFDNRTASNEGVALFVTASNGASGRVSVGNNTAFIIESAPGVYALDTWFHFAVTRASNTLRAFIDGTEVGSVTDSRTYASSSTAFIGSQYNNSARMLGRVDDVRVTKGVARYTGNFTPPAAAFPDP